MEELVRALPVGLVTSVHAKVRGSAGVFGSVLAEALRSTSRFKGTVRPVSAEGFGGSTAGAEEALRVAVAFAVTVELVNEVIVTTTAPLCAGGSHAKIQLGQTLSGNLKIGDHLCGCPGESAGQGC